MFGNILIKSKWNPDGVRGICAAPVTIIEPLWGSGTCADRVTIIERRRGSILVTAMRKAYQGTP